MSRRQQAGGGGGGGGVRGLQVRGLQVRGHAQAGAGIAVGPASDEGAGHPAAVVPLHVAGHVEGVRASLTHDGPVCRDGVRREGARGDEGGLK